jgi:phosphatidylglycerophosphatase C
MVAKQETKQNTKDKTASSVKQQLVLFDFDGTITTHDTLAEFMIYYHGKPKYYLGLSVLSPIMILYTTKLIKNWKAKQYFLSWFLKGSDAKDFKKKCFEFSKQVIPKLIRPGVFEAIKQYKQAGATIAIVSASAQDWVQPWCDEHGLQCIATRLEVENNKITGKILGKNCHGPEKVCRIKESFDLSSFEEIIAYGDTSGDKEMLALAHKSFYKPFREKVH